MQDTRRSRCGGPLTKTVLARAKAAPCGPFYLHHLARQREGLKPGQNLLSTGVDERSDKATDDIVVGDDEGSVNVEQN